MIRCSSLMQVKYNWYRMGTFVLSVKRNKCKNPIARSSVKFFLRKNCSLNPTTNPRGNAQQVAFTPIKFAEQSYCSKSRHCAFIHKVAKSKKQLSQRKQILKNC